MTLPLELVDEIIDYSVGDPSTLEKCSLVSRAWVSRCRSHLFEKCALWPSTISAFCDLLRSPECTFLYHVRSINSIKHYGPRDYDSYLNGFAGDLGRLINVRELEMTVMAPYSVEKFHTFLCTSFPKITRLVLDLRNARHSEFTLVANMICLFPTLQELDMTMTGPSKDIPADVVPPPELRSLHLCKHSVQVLSWFDVAHRLSNVHSLTLPCPRGLYVPIVRKALEQIGSELLHLDLTLPNGLERVELSQMIDLFLHQNLKTLRITDLSWISRVEEMILWIPRLIMQLRTSALELLTLVLPLCWPPYETLDWAALDAMLSPARFPCLRSVVIKCEYHGDRFFYAQGRKLDTHEFVRKALPVLADSGMLQTEW
ncbi:hypothetical protein MSAN_02194700 [Mycena sanguinolenta]|uniref:F-box domain-containing protein n=1 Tax=Mycena sanguinolenta TaxID=230812 RepID=A0A8H7CII3_9AGAR|nr:hypothetical protein MSAN_02194700 [Mycena sanguinolenta]